MLSDKTYKILRYISMIGIPALCFFLTTIGDIWNFGWMTNVVATIAAVGTFLGALLQVTTKKYWEENSNEERNDNSGI